MTTYDEWKTTNPADNELGPEPWEPQMPEELYELNVYIVCIRGEEDARYYIGLVHPDGRRELSNESWATEQECAQAIDAYAAEKGGVISRLN